MSYSPPPRRLAPTSPTKREEELINAYEAEEERLVNIISRKLEKLKEEKIDLENALEAESEAHVNRLSRELTALRLQQQQLQQANGNAEAGPSGSNQASTSQIHPLLNTTPRLPSADILLDAVRRDNEELRGRLAETEQAYIRASRLNDIYREELIEHRRKLGIPVDNLIGMGPYDPFSQPTHHRRTSSNTSPTVSRASPSSSTVPMPAFPTRSSVISVPLARPPSQIHRASAASAIPINNPSSSASAAAAGYRQQQQQQQHHYMASRGQQTQYHHHYGGSFSSVSTTPSVTDSPDSVSPYPLSPVTTTNPASYLSTGTSVTTPSSSASLSSNPPALYPLPHPNLTYPSVPPPSLSSSFGSPSVSSHIPQAMLNGHRGADDRERDRDRDRASASNSASNSPVDPLSRRNSLSGLARQPQRRGSIERWPASANGSTGLGGITEDIDGNAISSDSTLTLTPDTANSDPIPIVNGTGINGRGRGFGTGAGGGGGGGGGGSRSRGQSYERGARVAETGSLLGMRSGYGRSRAASDHDVVPEVDPLEGESMPLG